MLTLLPTPIGNIEDMSIRAMRVLEEADTLLCEDTRVAKKLLRLLSERYGLTHRIERFVSLHSHNEKQWLESVDPAFFRDRHVVYMSDAGMPCISDPGAELVRWCQEHDVAYTVVPGPSAFATAYAASGFADPKFLFFGFLPHKGEARREGLAEVLAQPHPVILYESPHRLGRLLEELTRLAPERELFLAKELTKRHERYFRGVPARLAEEIDGPLLKGEWVVVVPPGSETSSGSALSPEAIHAMAIPPRQKAKLLAKATGRPVSECYRELVRER